LYEQDEQLPSKMGQYLQNLLPLEKGESIIGMLTTNQYKGYVFIMYENGKLAKVEMESFKTKFNVKKLKNSLSLDSPVVYTIQANNDIILELTDCFNKNKVINTKDINPKKSRNTMGVSVWNSKKQNWKITHTRTAKKEGNNE